MGLDDGRDITRARATRPTRSAGSRTDYGSTAARKPYDPYANRRDAAGNTGFGASRSPGTRASGSTEPRVGVSDYLARAASAGVSAPPGGNAGGGGTGGTGGTVGAGGSTGGTDTGGTDTGDGDISADDQVDLGDEALNATLAAIAAQFGMTNEQLLADEGEAGRQYRQILAGMQQQKLDDVEATNDDLVARGILRSGETLENHARLEKGFAANKSAARGDRNAALASIATQRASLGPAQAAQEATAKAGHAASERDLELMRSLYGSDA